MFPAYPHVLFLGMDGAQVHQWTKKVPLPSQFCRAQCGPMSTFRTIYRLPTCLNDDLMNCTTLQIKVSTWYYHMVPGSRCVEEITLSMKIEHHRIFIEVYHEAIPDWQTSRHQTYVCNLDDFLCIALHVVLDWRLCGGGRCAMRAGDSVCCGSCTFHRMSVCFICLICFFGFLVYLVDTTMPWTSTP